MMNEAVGAPPLLRIENVSLRFERRRTLTDLLLRRPARVVRTLNDISLSVGIGETLGIVGESGCGKSTLARCIVRLLKPNEGHIVFDGSDVGKLAASKRRQYNRKVQMIFQDPYTSLNPRMTVGQVLAEALSVHAMRPRDQIGARVGELLELVRLPAASIQKYPHEFSGGQRQRIAIARALAVEPVCLVADELVSALDVSVQAQVVNLLVDLQERLGLAIVFVAHDLRLVRHVSHRVAVIYLGSVVEIGPSESLFAAPLHPYSKALLASAPSLAPRRRRARAAIAGELPSPLAIPTGCPFHPRCPHATEICRTERPSLSHFHDGNVACHHAADIARR
ncbi:ABC transporter ATP-binding protein [Mesorhizobium koreense]|uniref:ABC transporter ATP-binding protein n=1 Tax=Mesorhizobium koreense TaxID=3074855 RepID=UPI00287BC85D|nr:oligopeptide/dipeptide ABC transporter ATP-binding protein [Mesorhizobium sp. WR6]